jgi:hypothetical protein
MSDEEGDGGDDAVGSEQMLAAPNSNGRGTGVGNFTPDEITKLCNVSGRQADRLGTSILDCSLACRAST